MNFINGLLNVFLVVCSLFLICLVLIQRGKGGGLAGAFGGMGGSSAFGTKAGDVFTKVTIVTAVIWFLLSMSIVLLNNYTVHRSAFDTTETASGRTSEKAAVPGTGKAPSKTAPGPLPPPAPSSKPMAPSTGKAAVGTSSTPGLPEVFEDEAEPKSRTAVPAKPETP